ncbi:MAG: phosphoenolpyruvate synthase regulatory protein [Nitrospirae bacterium GWC2_57_9]|nr:MAG: phosphoenolpyruvate synthase regulatory protein [Nitrospirae bacterium GWC2_57_9]
MSTKKIYILSDATGQSALHVLRAAIVQFNHADTRTTLFHDINTRAALKKALDRARSNNALIAFTFVRKEMRDYANDYCARNGIFHHDILGPLITDLAAYMELEPLETPSLLRKVDERYFKRIEAIEYTLGHDDGRGAERLKEADIVIVGLSRTSKTPTSFYLAQEGYKVANVPIVPGIPLPEELSEIDQRKIVCLNIDPEFLQKIRTVRQKHSHLSSGYSDLKKIVAEVEYVWDLMRKHRTWKVVDTTNKSVEETAWEIIHHVVGDERVE